MGAGGGWTDRAPLLPSLTSARLQLSVSVPVLHPGDPEPTLLCPGEMVIDRMVQSVSHRLQRWCALAPSLPWLVLTGGLHKPTPFTVLCAIIAWFGRAAVPGAGAVPGQGCSVPRPPVAPCQPHAQQIQLHQINYSRKNNQINLASPIESVPSSFPPVPVRIFPPTTFWLWWVMYSPPPWAASLLPLTVFLQRVLFLSFPSVLTPAAPEERERTGINWLIVTFSLFFLCGAERGDARHMCESCPQANFNLPGADSETSPSLGKRGRF